MSILGVDWGKKRIGVAIARGPLAEPYGVVGSFGELAEVIRQKDIKQVVLGVPEGKHEKEVRSFGKRIKEELGIPVVLRSEVLTSHLARQKLIEAGKSRDDHRFLDAAAAALLLQEFLDSTRY